MGTQVLGATFSGSDLSGGEFSSFDWRAANVTHCDLTNSELGDLDIRGVDLQGVKLDSYRASLLPGTSWYRCHGLMFRERYMPPPAPYTILSGLAFPSDVSTSGA